jgi:hypothetical protein
VQENRKKGIKNEKKTKSEIRRKRTKLKKLRKKKDKMTKRSRKDKAGRNTNKWIKGEYNMIGRKKIKEIKVITNSLICLSIKRSIIV